MEKSAIYFVGVPKSFRRPIAQIVKIAVATVRKKLGYQKPIDVAIFEAQPEYVIPETGMSGSAIGKSGIEIRIDLSKKFQKKKFRDELSASVLHEAAHIVRENAVGYNKSLGDAIINEGFACWFEKICMSSRTIPYIAPVPKEKVLLRKAKKDFSKKNFDYGEWFFGSEKFARWAGYP